MRSPTLLLSLLSLTLLASANAAPIVILHPEDHTLVDTRDAAPKADLGPSRFAHAAESYKRDQHAAHPAPADSGKASFRDTAESYKREASVPLAASWSGYDTAPLIGTKRDDGRALDAGDQGGRFGKGAWFGAESYKRGTILPAPGTGAGGGAKPKGSTGAGGKAGWKNSGSDFKRDEGTEDVGDDNTDGGEFGKGAWANSGGDFKRAVPKKGADTGKGAWANSGGDFKRSEGREREHGGSKGRADCGGRGTDACM